MSKPAYRCQSLMLAGLALLAAWCLPNSLLAQAPCVTGWVPQQFGEAPGMSNLPFPVVYELLVHDDGSGPALFAGGTFFEAGASGAHSVARWDGARWSPLPGNSVQTHALAVHDDGTGPALYTGPWFSSTIGMNRWDGSNWTFVGQGLGGFVESMVSFDDGSGPALYVGGALSLTGGVTAGIARWTGTQWEIPGGGIVGTVNALLVADLGGGERLYAAGAFTSAGGGSAGGFAAWDGNAWSSPGTFDGSPLSMALHDSGGGPELIVGGTFTDVSGVAATGVAAWNGATWAPVGTGIPGPVNALASFDEGGGSVLVAAGDFASAGGVTANRIAAWDGVAWQPLDAGLDANGAALAVFDPGSGPELYAGGAFLKAGGRVAQQVARWSGGSWRGLGQGFNDDVLASAVFDDGNGPALYVGGEFKTIAGLDVSYLARWDGTTWSAVGTGGPTAPVRCLIVHDDGAGPELYAGGLDVRRWDGATWEALPGISGKINAFEVYDGPGFGGPLLFAAGKFGGGVYDNIARLFGTSWLTVKLGLTGASAEVFDLAVYDDGSGEALYAGGVFSSSGGVSVRNIARWNGIDWSPLGAGSVGTNDVDDVWAIEVFDDGKGPKLYAKGAFAGAPGPVGVWDGSAWGDPGFGLNVYAITEMAVHDDGSGPALYTNGRLTTSQSSLGTIFTRFDGATLTVLQEGIQGTLETIRSADLGQGPEVFVGGTFQHLADVGDSYFARWRTCFGGWEDLGGGAPGSAGTPSLSGTGPLTSGSSTTLGLTAAPPSALLVAWVSFAPVPFEAVGGTVHAFPFAAQFFFVANAQGDWSVTTPWPSGLPAGTESWFQLIVQDASVPDGLTISNGLKATAD